MPLAASEPAIYVRVQPQTYALRYGYIVARNDTTQQSGQTPDKEAEIKNIIVFVSSYTETDTTGMLSPPTVWRHWQLLLYSFFNLCAKWGRVVNTTPPSLYPRECPQPTVRVWMAPGRLMVGWLMYDELKKKWKSRVVACLSYYPSICPEGLKKL